MAKKQTLLIYLSGKISGVKDLNKPKFRAAEKLILSELIDEKRFVWVCNPHDLPDDHDKSWGAYMRECLKALTSCEKIFVLDDWKKSRGALVEVLIAKILGIELCEVATMRTFSVSYFNLFVNLLFKL